MTIPSDFFPPREAKARVGVTERTLRNWADDKTKPVKLYKYGGLTLFKASEILAMIQPKEKA